MPNLACRRRLNYAVETMKIGNFLLILYMFFICVISVFGQTSLIIYDPTEVTPVIIREDEAASIKQFALPKAKKIWNDEVCAEDFKITGAATGSFTKKDAAQKAFLYEYCQTGNGWANDGIVITETGKPVAHYTFEGSWTTDLSALPDINQNGINELAVFISGGMHQGISGAAVVLLELSANDVREFGSLQTAYYGCGGEYPEKPCDYEYKITVKPAATPVFYRQKMSGKGKRWRMLGKLQKVSPEKTTVEYKSAK